MRGMSALLWYAAVSSSGSTRTWRPGSIVLMTCRKDGGAWPRKAVRASTAPRTRAAARSATHAISFPMVAEARGSALPCATATRTGSDGTCSGMYAALRLARSRPPPAARIGARLDANGAGRAADRRIAVVDQRVDQHAVGGDEVVHLLLRPADDRVDLDHLPPVVPLDHPRLAADVGLVPADAGDPRVVLRQRPLKRFDLAQVTAQIGI